MGARDEFFERAVARYEGQSRRRIEVPELGAGGEPFALYADPYTIDDDQHLARFERENDPRGFVEVVWRKALDADGNRLFTDAEDRIKLGRIIEASVLKRVAMQIMAGTVDVDTARGNSNRTPDSGGGTE